MGRKLSAAPSILVVGPSSAASEIGEVIVVED